MSSVYCRALLHLDVYRACALLDVLVNKFGWDTSTIAAVLGKMRTRTTSFVFAETLFKQDSKLARVYARWMPALVTVLDLTPFCALTMDLYCAFSSTHSERKSSRTSGAVMRVWSGMMASNKNDVLIAHNQKQRVTPALRPILLAIHEHPLISGVSGAIWGSMLQFLRRCQCVSTVRITVPCFTPLLEYALADTHMLRTVTKLELNVTHSRRSADLPLCPDTLDLAAVRRMFAEVITEEVVICPHYLTDATALWPGTCAKTKTVETIVRLCDEPHPTCDAFRGRLDVQVIVGYMAERANGQTTASSTNSTEAFLRFAGAHSNLANLPMPPIVMHNVYSNWLPAELWWTCCRTISDAEVAAVQNFVALRIDRSFVCSGDIRVDGVSLVLALPLAVLRQARRLWLGGNGLSISQWGFGSRKRSAACTTEPHSHAHAGALVSFNCSSLTLVHFFITEEDDWKELLRTRWPKLTRLDIHACPTASLDGLGHAFATGVFPALQHLFIPIHQFLAFPEKRSLAESPKSDFWDALKHTKLQSLHLMFVTHTRPSPSTSDAERYDNGSLYCLYSQHTVVPVLDRMSEIDSLRYIALHSPPFHVAPLYWAEWIVATCNESTCTVAVSIQHSVSASDALHHLILPHTKRAGLVVSVGDGATAGASIAFSKSTQPTGVKQAPCELKTGEVKTSEI